MVWSFSTWVSPNPFPNFQLTISLRHKTWKLKTFVLWICACSATSATSHVVLGQFKTCVILLGGYVLFDSDPGFVSICGAVAALFGMSVYTSLNLKESKESSLSDQISKQNSFSLKPKSTEDTTEETDVKDDSNVVWNEEAFSTSGPFWPILHLAPTLAFEWKSMYRKTLDSCKEYKILYLHYIFSEVLKAGNLCIEINFFHRVKSIGSLYGLLYSFTFVTQLIRCIQVSTDANWVLLLKKSIRFLQQNLSGWKSCFELAILLTNNFRCWKSTITGIAAIQIEPWKFSFSLSFCWKTCSKICESGGKRQS